MDRPRRALWVKRSIPVRRAPELDVFDVRGRRTMQVVLTRGRQVVGFGVRALYAVLTDDRGLQILERHAVP